MAINENPFDLKLLTRCLLRLKKAKQETDEEPFLSGKGKTHPHSSKNNGKIVLMAIKDTFSRELYETCLSTYLGSNLWNDRHKKFFKSCTKNKKKHGKNFMPSGYFPKYRVTDLELDFWKYLVVVWLGCVSFLYQTTRDGLSFDSVW